MKIGLSSLLFTCGRVEEAVRAASELGYEAVEIVYDLPHFGRGREPDLNKLRELIKEASLSVSVHSSFWDLNPGSLYPEVRQLTLKMVKRSAEVCKQLGGEVLVVHPGKCPAPDSPEVYGESLRSYRDFLKELVPWVRGLGLKLCLENGNSKDNPCSLLPELGELAAEKGVGITLDLAHACLRYGPKNVDRILRDMKKISSLIWHVHLHDNLGQKDDHLVPGEGKLRLSPLLECLKEMGYSSLVVAELWNPRDPWGTARRARKALRKLF